MARTPSQAFKDVIFERETSDGEIILLVIEQNQLSEPIRLASDGPMELSNGNAGVISEGVEYVYFPFEAVLPGDSADGFPVAKLKIDNVSREIIDNIQKMNGPASLTFLVCLQSNPDMVEITVPGLTLRNITADAMSVEGDLTPEQYDTEKFPSGRFTPSMFPGLFPGTG